MYSFDASSMIHAWDNYPPENPLFGALWGWVAEKPQAKKLKFVGILINKDVSHENHRERCKKSSLGRVVGGKPCGFWVFYWIPACETVQETLDQHTLHVENPCGFGCFTGFLLPQE